MVEEASVLTGIAEKLCASKGWSVPTYIDAGNSAAVYETETHDLGRVALKIYHPSFFEGENAEIEAQRLRLQTTLTGHGCPQLINFIECGEFAERKTWYLLMEYCGWDTLAKRLGDIPDQQVPILIKELAKAILFLEEQSIVHRDIKPANILVSSDFTSVKLLDLGVLRNTGDEKGNGTDHGEKRTLSPP